MLGESLINPLRDHGQLLVACSLTFLIHRLKATLLIDYDAPTNDFEVEEEHGYRTLPEESNEDKDRKRLGVGFGLFSF